MRSHPPTLITLARGAILRRRLFTRGDLVLVAVSGGRDSLALLHVLAWLRKQIGHAVVAHGVDHGLRAAARDELDLAARLADRLEVPFARTRTRVAPGGNLQARARAARYEALEAAARTAGASALATGHHADDRAETLLLRLVRGTGPAGLAVLPARTLAHGALPRVRPFIDARRAAIDAHLGRHRIEFADDPSNVDPRFARTRVRRELVPLLETMNPNVVEHLCALAERMTTEAPRDPGEGSLGRAGSTGTAGAAGSAQEPNERANAARARPADPTRSEPALVPKGPRTHVDITVPGRVAPASSSTPLPAPSRLGRRRSRGAS